MLTTELMVQKYGGSSVGNSEALEQSASVIAQSR